MNKEQKFFSGKGVVVYGATGGLGEVLCAELYSKVGRLILAGRNQQKLQTLQRRLKNNDQTGQTTEIWPILSESSILDFAQRIREEQLDGLIIATGKTAYQKFCAPSPGCAPLREVRPKHPEQPGVVAGIRRNFGCQPASGAAPGFRTSALSLAKEGVFPHRWELYVYFPGTLPGCIFSEQGSFTLFCTSGYTGIKQNKHALLTEVASLAKSTQYFANRWNGHQYVLPKRFAKTIRANGTLGTQCTETDCKGLITWHKSPKNNYYNQMERVSDLSLCAQTAGVLAGPGFGAGLPA